MAWIVRKGSAFLVRWRDERRKVLSRYFTEEADALTFKQERDGEALARRVLDPRRPGYVDLFAHSEALVAQD